MTILNTLVTDLYHVLSWVPWVMGGGAVMYALLAVLALVGLPFATAALNIVSPILKALAQGAVDFVTEVLMPGAADMLDNWKSCVFVLVIAITVGYFSWDWKECPVTYRNVNHTQTKVRTVTKKVFVNPFKFSAPKKTPAVKAPVVQSEHHDTLVRPFWEDGEADGK